MGDDSSVEISLIASVTDKQLIGPAVSPSLPVSTAVRAGPRVFLSGVLGNTDANVGDVVAQTREMLTRIKRTLDVAGLSFVDVVDSTVYLPDIWQTTGWIRSTARRSSRLPRARPSARSSSHERGSSRS